MENNNLETDHEYQKDRCQDGQLSMSKVSDSDRPPNLNLTCCGHGGREVGLVGDGANYAAMATALDFHREGPEPARDKAMDDDSDVDESEVVDGEEGAPMNHEVGDLGRHDPREVGRVLALHNTCHCQACDCSNQVRYNGSFDEGTILAPTPPYSRMATRTASMGTENGSMMASMYSIRSWSSTELLAFVGYALPGISDLFVQPPLRLTATPVNELPVFPYATELHDSDFEDFD